MSVINKVLQDLDARNALPLGDDMATAHHVRAVTQPAAGREWFWRILAALALAGLGWLGWVAWQMQPRSVATELAFAAAEQARSRPAPPQVDAPNPVVPAAPKTEATPAQAPNVEAPVSALAEPPPVIAELKLTDSISTPIAEKPSPGKEKPPPHARPAAAPKPAAAASPAGLPPSAVEPATRLAKRERPQSNLEEAESLFRNGVNLLRQRRASEAMESFYAALAREPKHHAARQALVSLLLERREIAEARRLLEEALALDPSQANFATVLARIHVESGDYRGAAAVLAAAAGAARDDAEFQVLRGAVLQRLGRHADAVEALQAATRIGNASGATWVALGVSLEALGRKADAVQAYRRSLSAQIGQDVRSYAESRIRALD